MLLLLVSAVWGIERGFAGATTALSVTFPMPVFGFLWGGLLLGERLTLGLVLGTVLILFGMALLTRPGRKHA